MKRLLSTLVLLLFASWTARADALLEGPSVSEVADFITELDVGKARDLLSKLTSDSKALAIERARLSLYMGDCDTATATLGTLSGVREAASLAEVARGCAHSTAGSVIVEDPTAGLWIRLQDGEDRVLVPLLSEV